MRTLHPKARESLKCLTHCLTQKSFVMASVTIVFRKDKINRKVQAPIHFRITKYGKSNYVAVGTMISAEHRDDIKKKVKSNHKNSGRLNSLLATKFAELQDSVLEHETISIIRQIYLIWLPQTNILCPITNQ